MKNFLAVAQTPAVLALQEERGSLGLYDTSSSGSSAIDENEIAFMESADSFYMATVNEEGWPYVQHKGGEAGFVKRLGPATIGWVERAGNRQYLGAGNITADGRVALIFVDYARRMRLKVLGRARHLATIPDDMVAVLNPEGLRDDGAFVIEVEATAWNCPKHITPRITVPEVETIVAGLQQRITDLEAQLAERTGDE